jgi:hypothetical protein
MRRHFTTSNDVVSQIIKGAVDVCGVDGGMATAGYCRIICRKFKVDCLLVEFAFANSQAQPDIKTLHNLDPNHHGFR